MKSFIVCIAAALFVCLSWGFNNDKTAVPNAIEKNVTFSTAKELLVGEELTYVVKYYLLKIGELRFKVVSKDKVNGKYLYSAIVYMDSYNGIPSVDLHQTYETKINPDLYSEFFRGIVKGKEYASFTDYFFNYNKKKIHVKKGKVNPYQIWNDTTGSIDKMYQDGLSIFYYARMHTGKKHSGFVPCMVNEKRLGASINYYDEVKKIKIDAINYDVAAVHLDGRTDFVSVFGLTGYFDGWFTNDAAAIPLTANLNVILGKISVELISWKRPGWVPPRYQ